MYQEELARRKFRAFCLWMDRVFFTDRPFLLDEIADVLQMIQDGTINTASISLPPRAGKSYVVSLFCAWWLGRNPTKCVMRNCVTTRLFEKFSYHVRDFIKSERYRQVFPDIQLSPDKQAIHDWALVSSTQSAYFGGGVTSNIIGSGANLAISDDLYAGFFEAMSPGTSEKTHMWKEGSHNSRMETGCAELYVGTRWMKDDVIGRAIERGKVQRIVSIPALTEDRRSFCEAVKTTAEYLAIEADVEEMTWRAEYMQEPIDAFGLLFPKDSLNFYKHTGEIEGDADVIHVDPANFGGDYFAAVHCVVKGNSVFVPWVTCTQAGSDATNIALEQYIRDREQGINYIEYEGVMQWQAVACELRNALDDLDDLEFRVTNPTTNKHTRILVRAPFIKKHFYFREDYKDIPEYRIFMKLLTAYLRDQSRSGPKINDDPPDVLAAAAAYLKRAYGHLWKDKTK